MSRLINKSGIVEEVAKTLILNDAVPDIHNMAKNAQMKFATLTCCVCDGYTNIPVNNSLTRSIGVINRIHRISYQELR